ncbi:MAG TPA: oligosaccharide flippase family protein [Thermoanaerobaculia bacterium]|jgi:O-antigen/teichoic acid export membrane protein
MSSLLANSLAMLVARILVPLFSFAINIGVARLAGAATLGAYVQLVALLLLFQTLAGAGLTPLLTREISARPDEAVPLLRKARTLALVTGCLSAAAFAAAAWTLLPKDRLAPALVLSAAVLPSAWISVQEAFFMARRTHHRVTGIALLEGALRLALAFLSIAFGGGLVGLCAGVTVARLAALGAGDLLVRRAGISGAWRRDASGAVDLGRAAAPFAALLVTSMLYFRVDVLLAGVLLGDGPTGVYAAALSLASVLLLLPESALAAIFPRLAAAFRSSVGGYADATLLSARVLAVGVVPFALVLVCAAAPILGLAFGSRFLPAAEALRLLAASLPLHAVNGALGQGLQAGHFQRPALLVVTIGVVLHVAGCLVLLPALGIAGAAVSMLVSSAAVAAGALWAFHARVRRLRIEALDLLLPAGVVAAMAAAVIAPDAWRVAAAGAGLALLAGILALGPGRGDLERVARSVRVATWRSDA